MNWNEICVAVIPCFNEAGNIGSLLRQIQAFPLKSIVVDDASTDSSVAEATEGGATVLSHAKNSGKGAALITGLTEAWKRGYAWAILLDGDGQHKPEHIPEFWQRAEQTSVALVIGNRMPNAQAIPWLRRRVNIWMSRRISQRAGCFFPDSQCGFRLVNLAIWTKLPIQSQHFEIESEMLIAFVKGGYPVEFIPISVVAAGRKSKIHPITDTIRWFRWWIRTR